ncbi:MAG: hypothetical protein JO154_24440 [Chitinophaga sp.]|uniref:hypothetical protein n=1 Tax=Chitinophaga sp. TaxID=1869181 RepID=UPI0025BB075A|nr:hypothetical protein [Chitinophaga sp.]MBV8255766.1 hypothetical protein [Chitinophaga sp.]
MLKYLYVLLLPVLITACSSNKGKYNIPHLKALTIQGEHAPCITFSYDAAGRLTAMTRFNNLQDSNTYKFLYDSYQRLSGMVCESNVNHQVKVTKRATVKDWDINGNIKKIEFFDQDQQQVTTAQVLWQGNQPLSLKYSNASQATSWNYVQGNPDWKNILQDTTSPDNNTIYFTKAICEWDPSSYNPMAQMANQLLLTDTIPQARPASPLPDITSLLLHISTNNPSRIKLEEKQENNIGNATASLSRSTTVQFMYASNGHGYPKKAQVYLHAQGYTQLNTDANTVVNYSYE